MKIPCSLLVCRWFGFAAISALGIVLASLPDVAAKAQTTPAAPPPPAALVNAKLPTVFLIGDSTVNTRTAGQQGWGDPIAAFFDTTKINVQNRALGGRSSRTFRTEGLWDRVLADIKPGDFVLMQFGHNDGGSLNTGRARASLKGNGDETQEVTLENPAGKKEVVHTYGWYLRQYAAEAKAKGAVPVVLSPIPRNIWTDARTVARSSKDYGKWAEEAAKSEKAFFIPLNELIATKYEAVGQETVTNVYFGPMEHTHTTPAGATVNATCVVQGIRALKDCALRDFLLPETPAATAAITTPGYRFDFGPSTRVAPGYTKVAPGIAYSTERGYGFEEGAAGVKGTDRGGSDLLHDDFCTGDQPFLFSVRVPEGNYKVTVTLGDKTAETSTTIKAELRRLMLEKVDTAPGQFVTRTFTVNIRTPRISSGGEVHLKEREKATEFRNWDDRLTLEFNGKRPCVSALEITPVSDVVTVYLMGDSTVTDQPGEPWASWGQMLPRFFTPEVAVANYAESGESLRSSLGAKRLDKVLSIIKPGDYLFVQFGHNDQKEHGEGIGAFTTYKTDLKHFVDEARKRGATPVLVTSMHRRRFDPAGNIIPTLGDYPEAVRQLAAEEKIALIDLNALSKTLFEALGSEGTLKAFVHYPAGTFPGQDKELKDDTHFNPYGAYELARCVVEGIRGSKLGLARFIAADAATPFDPAHPDPAASWHLPVSPARAAVSKPDGS